MPFSEQEVTRHPCYTDAEFITLGFNVKKVLNLTLHDSAGNPLDLTFSEDDGSESSSSSSSEPITINFVGKTTFASDTPMWTVPVTVVDADAGTVQLTANKTDITKEPGLYVANMLIYRGEDLLQVIPYYVEISTNTLSRRPCEPITVGEVRLELRDTCPDANVLLDELEFTDAEIIHCMKKAIDAFNAIPPLIVSYNTNEFPWRAKWLSATVGYLLRIAAAQYRRNNLRYSAGGISVDDKNKAQEYEALGVQLIQEWENWAQQTKISINVAMCYGTVGSGYYR